MLMQEKADSLRDEAAEIEQAPRDLLPGPVTLDLDLDIQNTQSTTWSDSQLSQSNERTGVKDGTKRLGNL